MSAMCIGKKLWYVSETEKAPIKVEVTGCDNSYCKIHRLNSSDEGIWLFANEIKKQLFEDYEDAKSALINIKVVKLFPSYLQLVADKMERCENSKGRFIEKIKKLNLWKNEEMLEIVLDEIIELVGIDLKYVVEETKKEEEQT